MLYQIVDILYHQQ